jgi:SpoVK/Ycf46/Vps4 family AAA+-type ATPase
MTSERHRIAASLPAQPRIALTVLAINAKKRLESRKSDGKPKPPLIGVVTSPHGVVRAAAIAVISDYLGAPVQRVDWSRLVSRYVHETELNLERMFSAAEDAGVLLLFDEADALFSPPGEPIDHEARDQEANGTALINRIVRFDGPLLVTASHRRRLDPQLLAIADSIIDLTGADKA